MTDERNTLKRSGPELRPGPTEIQKFFQLHGPSYSQSVKFRSEIFGPDQDFKILDRIVPVQEKLENFGPILVGKHEPKLGSALTISNQNSRHPESRFRTENMLTMIRAMTKRGILKK